MKKNKINALMLCCVMSLSMTFYSCDIVDDILEDVEENTDVPEPNINNGLVYYSTFDDGSAINVLSGADLNGVFVNNPDIITDTPNGKGKAVLINSLKNQWMTIPGDPLHKQYENFAISFWIKDFSVGNIILALDNGKIVGPTISANGDNFFNVEIQHSLLKDVEFGGYSYNAIQDGKWHQVAVNAVTTDDERYMELYVDGRKVDMAKFYAFNVYLQKFQIGSDSAGVSIFKFDNIRFYNRSLTSEEAKMIYDTEK